MSSDNRPIRIAQLGIGHNHADAKMISLKGLPELFEVVGVAEDNDYWRNARSGYAVYKDVPFMSEEELLNTLAFLKASEARVN